MGIIRLRQTEAAGQSLEKISESLKKICLRLEQLLEEDARARAVRTDSDQQEMEAEMSIRRCIRETADLFSEEAASLGRAAASLRESVRLYGRAEKRVVEIFQGEYLVVPRTRFDTSYFESLASCAQVMPIRGTANVAGFEERVESAAKEELPDLKGIL